MEKYKLLFLIVLVSNLSIAGEFEQGIKYFEQHDYAQAKTLWLPLAEQGDARAQYNLALLSKQKSPTNSKKMARINNDNRHKYLAMSRDNGLVDAYFAKFDISNISTSSSLGSSASEPLSWLNQQQKRAYTLQLATGKSWESMAVMKKQLVSHKKLAQPENIYIHEIEKIEDQKTVKRYILVYGVFNSYLEAKNASGTLPESIQKSTPWIRQFGVLQSIVNKKQEKTES